MHRTINKRNGQVKSSMFRAQCCMSRDNYSMHFANFQYQVHQAKVIGIIADRKIKMVFE